VSETVHISKVDETYIKIEASLGVLQELSALFTFEVPNSRFFPAVKARLWDGRMRLLNLGGPRTLYSGLHSYVRDYALQEGYECIYADPLDSEIEFSVHEARRMFDALKLSTVIDGVRKSIEVREHQERAIIQAIQARRSLLLSPTSSGKSLIIYCLLRYYLATTRGKILVIVPSVSLVKQLHDDFADYSSLDPRWKAEEHCHMLYQGQEKQTHKRVVISTWQSIYKQQKTYFEQFNTVFGDEVHLFASKEISNLMSKLTKAKFRHGTTGTLTDSKTNEMVLEGLFGRVFKTITTRELMDKGTVASLMIKCLQLGYTAEDRKLIKKALYKDEMDFLVAHQGRNKFIRNLALSLKGNVLILFQFVDKHGKILDRMISERNNQGRKTFFVCGETDADTRNGVRKIVESETDAIITASYGVFSTGVSIRNINYVIFASPTKSKIRVLQSVGRGLRVSDRKNSVVLFDVADDLTTYTKKGTTSWENYSLQHFLERINFYNAEEFDYKLYKIDLSS
jgi:superfamily II DNA or RNA helicase